MVPRLHCVSGGGVTGGGCADVLCRGCLTNLTVPLLSFQGCARAVGLRRGTVSPHPSLGSFSHKAEMHFRKSEHYF